MKWLRIATNQRGIIFAKAKHTAPDALSKELGGTNATLSPKAEASYPRAESSNSRAEVKLPGDITRNLCYTNALRRAYSRRNAFIGLQFAIQRCVERLQNATLPFSVAAVRFGHFDAQ